MTCEEIVAAYLDALKGSMSCKDDGGRFSLVLPFFYPDHDNLEIFVKVVGDGVVISDLGETLRRLDVIRMDAGGKLAYMEQIAHSFNVKMHHGVLFNEGISRDVGNLVVDLVSACMAVGSSAYWNHSDIKVPDEA